MAAVRKVSGTAESLPQSLANDLRLISNEAKKKYPAVREASERCLMQVRKLANDSKTDFVTGKLPHKFSLYMDRQALGRREDSGMSGCFGVCSLYCHHHPITL
jgi:hypothetical protein